MTDQSTETGLEVVLDNRKLILAFVLLVAICGCFFVIGFVEGKRQGYQEGAQVAAESSGAPGAETVPPPSAAPAAPVAVATLPKEGETETRLDWYDSVNRPDGDAEAGRKILPPSPAPPAPTPKKESPPPASAASKTAAKTETAKTAAPSAYTVQVGAFRQKSEAEAKVRQLKAKGFESRIEPPKSAEDLYLIQVGRFKSRADAVAMQLRLKKSGFSSFIKAY